MDKIDGKNVIICNNRRKITVTRLRDIVVVEFVKCGIESWAWEQVRASKSIVHSRLEDWNLKYLGDVNTK